jgi:N-acetylglucosamine-6-sulfatase
MRPTSPLLLALLCLFGLALPGCSDVAAADERPNVLHVLTDDQTIDSLRYMQTVQSELVDGGTTFTNYHTVQPLCCPSRATFLTGQYPHNHGVLSNLEPYGWQSMDFSRTIYTSLHDAGYRTGWIGKVMNAKGEEGLDPVPGMDDWLVPVGAQESSDMFDFTLSDDGVAHHYRGPFETDVLAARAHDFIAESAAGEQPFMLTVSVHSPHWVRCPKTHDRCGPQPAPEDVGTMPNLRFPAGPDFPRSPAQRTATDRYWEREVESLQSVDRMVGDMVEQLRDLGELDDTVIVFQSDNGMLHGEHGIFDKDVPWDRSVRVPLVISGPGFDAGAVRDDLTANVDVPATILDLADAEPPRPPDGFSLLSDHRRKELLLERLVTSNDNWSYRWRQLKTAKGMTYWRDLDSGRRYLFDLRRDPHQVHNLARRKPGLARSLERRMERVRNCADPCP